MFDGPALLGLKPHVGGTRLPQRDKPISALLKDPAVQERMKNPARQPLKIPGTIEPDIQGIRMVTLEELDLAKSWTKKKTDGDREPRGSAMIKLRERHHAVARLLAAGVTPTQIQEMLDVDQTTVTNLQKSPAFQSLLFSYAAEYEKTAKDYKGRLEAVAGAALNELHERLVAAPETFSNGVLLQTVNSLADRTGHGPTSKVINTNVALTPADIRALKAGLAPATLEAERVEPPGVSYSREDHPLPAVRPSEEPVVLRPEGVSVSGQGGADAPAGVQE